MYKKVWLNERILARSFNQGVNLKNTQDMIKIIKQKKIAGKFQIEIESQIFGLPKFNDIQVRDTEIGVAAYWHDTKKLILTVNFDRYISMSSSLVYGEPNPTYVVSLEILTLLNKRFCEDNNNLTSYGIATDILKNKKRLYAILPGKTRKSYNMLHNCLGEMINFCKKETTP